VQGVNSGGNRSILDLAEVRPPDTCHVSKLSLRQAMLFPQLAQTTTETDGKRDCHPLSLPVLLNRLFALPNINKPGRARELIRETKPEGFAMIYRVAVLGALLVAGMMLSGCHSSPSIKQVATDTKTQLQGQLNQDFADKRATVQNVSMVQTTAPKYEGEATIAAYNQTFTVPLIVTSDGKTTLVTADAQKLSNGFETALERDLAILNGKYSDHIIRSDIFEMMPASLKAAKADFAARLETVAPIESDGRYFFGSGCKAHECTKNEAAWVIDKITGKGAAVIMKDEPANLAMSAHLDFHLYGVIDGEFPHPLLEWAEQRGMTNMNVASDKSR
jgi:outer membrane murein-binding lipoprotein Lpp